MTWPAPLPPAPMTPGMVLPPRVAKHTVPSTVDDVMLNALYPAKNAEREYLGAMLAADDAGPLLHRSRVEPKHLQADDLASILETMIAMRDRAEIVNQLTVATEVGPRLESTVWMLDAITPAYVDLFAEQILKRFRRRRIAESGGVLAGIARDAATSDLDAQVEATVSLMAEDAPAIREPRSLQDGLEQQLIGSDPIVTYPTPWPKLTRAIDGLRGGSLYCVAGETGSGKSAVALQLAYGLAEHGNVIYFSMEMPEDEVRLRVISQQTRIASKLIEHHRVPEGVVRDRLEVWRWSSALPQLYVVDDTSLTAAEMRRQALALDGGVTGIVVDQLSLMDHGEHGRENESTTLARTTQSLKNLAMDLDIPVILLTQLNREGTRQRPTRNHLFGSSGIGNAADVILLLWRENVENDADLTVLIDKNRQGRPGYTKLEWQGEFFRAVDPDVREDW